MRRSDAQMYGCWQSSQSAEQNHGTDVLIQVNAVKSALHKVGQIVLEGHLNHCVREGIEHGDADKTIADFAKAVEHFSRMT